MEKEEIIKFITNACSSFYDVECIENIYLLNKKDRYFIQYVLNTETIYAKDIEILIQNYLIIRENIGKQIDYGICTLEGVSDINEPKVLVYPITLDKKLVK